MWDINTLIVLNERYQKTLEEMREEESEKEESENETRKSD